MEGVVRFSINCTEWGQIKVLRPHPIGDEYWGVLAPLKGTVWGDLIPVVSGETFSHALYGHTMPLLREIGPPPDDLSRKIPDSLGRCQLATAKACLTITPNCRPGKKLPDCFEAPGEYSELASMVALTWAEGRYVVVVEGPELVF